MKISSRNFNFGSEEDYLKYYLKSIPKYDISAKQEKEYFEKIKLGDLNARKEFINKNLSYVVSLVYKETRGKKYKLDFMDLVQVGNIGLMRAVDKFDSSREYRFATYASYWIKQRIKKTLSDQNKTIRLPINKVDDLNKISRTKKNLSKRLEREPTDEEIRLECGFSEKKYYSLKAYNYEVSSYDIEVDNDDPKKNETLKDLLPSDENNPTLLCEEIDKIDLIKRFVNENLTEKEKEILYKRFGLDDGIPKTLQEIGNQYGLTRERIRIIVDKSIKRIRNSSEINAFKDYIEDSTLKYAEENRKTISNRRR